jgi:mRNA interferase RelE/StbE
MADPKSVRLSRRAEKALEAVEAHYKDHFKEAIRELPDNPLLGKKLKGEFEGLRSYRVARFRIVYRFTKDQSEVVFIDDRKDVYR